VPNPIENIERDSQKYGRYFIMRESSLHARFQSHHLIWTPTPKELLQFPRKLLSRFVPNKIEQPAHILLPLPPSTGGGWRQKQRRARAVVAGGSKRWETVAGDDSLCHDVRDATTLAFHTGSS
jgi:hypothetical protein